MVPVVASKLATPKNIKTVIIIVIVIIVIVIAVRQYNKYQDKAEAKKLVGAADNEIIKGTQTKTDSDYKALANKIFVALDATVSDETAAVQVIAGLKTKSDWLSLVKAFGVKDKGVKFFKTPMNLVGWLTDELSDKNKALVNYSLQRFGVEI